MEAGSVQAVISPVYTSGVVYSLNWFSKQFQIGLG